MKAFMKFSFHFLLLMMTIMSVNSLASEEYLRGEPFRAYQSSSDHYLKKVQPILDKRCVVCHSCYEAPCQLKLTSFEMLDRGANKHITSGGLFSAAPRTDLDFTKEAQKKDGFYSVTEGGANSILLNLLVQGQDKTNLPPQKFVPAEKQACVDSTKEFNKLNALKKKTLGMPYYMAPLENDEFQILTSWIAGGAQPPSESAIEELSKPRNPKAIQAWEAFFNNTSWKARWTSRYLYEHLFTAHLYIEESPGEFYELVRSSTPAPMKIDIIPTERPFVMPKKFEQTFYYRLKKLTSTVLHKQHFVYRIDAKIMKELKSTFWNSQWQGTPETAPFNFKNANPFVAFKHIPASVRYKWMLKNAKMLLDMDMRSDNCHGKGATGPLRDDFFVLFVKPESDVTSIVPNFYDVANPYLRMANTEGETKTEIGLNNATMNLRMFDNDFSDNQNNYGKIKYDFQRKLLPNGLHFNDIWDGENSTQTPIFTILRHANTVSVHEGPWGPVARNTLLFDYASFERLYYNCVALTTLFDNINDKVGTVVYLRKVSRETEEQVLSLIPDVLREKIRKDWVQGFGEKYDIDASKFSLPFNPALAKIQDYRFDNSDPYKSMMSYLLLKSGRFNEKSIGTNFYPTSIDTQEFKSLKSLSNFMSNGQIRGEENRATHFPNVSYIVVKGHDMKPRYYTVIVNRFYEFVNAIDLIHFGKLESGRVPKKDTMIIFQDVVANYPSKIYHVDEDDFDKLLSDMKEVKSRADYVNFDKTYGLQKMSDEFWPTIDQIQTDFIQKNNVQNGQLDLIEYGNHDLLGSM